jgi:ubiquinone/menaquinone biosynthesis C-methylase UbiE
MTIQDKEKLEQKHFDHLAANYDQNYGYSDLFNQYKAERRVLKIIKIFSPKNPISIIEIGCGTGEYTRLLAKYYPESQVFAFDISLNMVKKAKEKCKEFPNAHFFVGSVYSLPYRYNFDLTCGFYILHHLDLRRTFEVIDPVVKPGGVLCFFEPNLLNPIVYVIKNIPIIKEKAGDSTDEYAINPFMMNRLFTGYKQIRLATNEFFPVIRILPFKVNIFLDNMTQLARFFPGINLLGGTIEMIYRKGS